MLLTHQADRSGKLLTFLRRELGLSSSLVKRLKWQNAFLVDGQPVHTDFPVIPGSTITVILEEGQPEFPPEDGSLDIVYEDEALLAVDKPAGLLMHPSFYRDRGTLGNRIAGYYEKTGQACAVHPVSRLDRDTFGVVLLAKNAHIHARMMTQLKTRQIQKTYDALVFGCPAEDQGLWQFPIGRRPGESLLRQVDPAGKEAVTRFEVTEVFDGCSRLRLEPVTGRTHQLRVHCAHVGCPILGDAQYGTADSLALSDRMELPHQQLCAVQLELRHPMTDAPLVITSKQKIKTG